MASESIWILGFGKFGRRAAALLTACGKTGLHITAIDSTAPGQVPRDVDFIQADGVQWFVDNFHRTSDVDRIIPALPVHLAAEWLRERLIADKRTVDRFSIPANILSALPNPYPINPHTYAISYATFRCPSDCDEPETFCTVTGKPRPLPLHKLVNALSFDNIVILVLQSRQFAPGVGGFYAGDLWRLLDIVRELAPADVVLCTSCKCHGIITGMRVMQ